MTLDPDEVQAMQRARILLVESEPAAARLVGTVLQGRQAEITIAGSAAEALRLVLGGFAPALVLLALDLPDLSGLDLLKVLRSLADTRNLPLIALATAGATVDEHTTVFAGCDGVIRKPIDPDTFPGQVAAFLRQPPRRSASGSFAIPRTTIGERQAAVLASMPKAVSVVSPDDLTMVYGNRRFEEMTGYRMPDLIGMPIAITNPGGTVALADLRAVIRRELDEHGEASYEVPRLRADRTTFWVQITFSRLDDAEQGELWVLVFDDVSRRRRADDDLKKALARSESRFASLWAAGILGIAVSDPSGRLIDANEAFLAMIGRTRDEVVHGRLTRDSYTAPAFQAEAGAATAGIRRGAVGAPRESEYLRPDGSVIPVLVGGALVDAATVVGYAVDLSEKRRGEDRLQRTEDQLRQAQKMEAVGRLAGGIAHDFNNLLSVIVSYSAMLLADLPPADPISADLREIQQAAARATDLTRQLLVFSRQQPMDVAVLEPGAVLHGMDRMLRRLIGEDIDLTVRADDQLGRVRLAPSHLEQVIVNLVVNAREAMPDGGRLTIETTAADVDASHESVPPGRYVMVAVTDTGCGMDRATLSRIFEPFFTTRPVGQGSGLGLSIVFGIVQQNGGHIRVDSEPGLGTTFTLYIPRVDEEVARPPTPVTTGPARGTETILLVEDEEQVRKVARGILRRHGYDVLEAANPGEASLLCEFHPGPIHLLLTDVVMPQMNGAELARQLAALRPALRVLCMSGYTDDAVARHRLLERGIAFLQKPLSPDALTRKVRDVLDAPAPGPEPTS